MQHISSLFITHVDVWMNALKGSVCQRFLYNTIRGSMYVLLEDTNFQQSLLNSRLKWALEFEESDVFIDFYFST